MGPGGWITEGIQLLLSFCSPKLPKGLADSLHTMASKNIDVNEMRTDSAAARRQALKTLRSSGGSQTTEGGVQDRSIYLSAG